MRVLKKSTGQTFHFWVIEFIMREAKLLLRSTTISITEISELPEPFILLPRIPPVCGNDPKRVQESVTLKYSMVIDF